MHHSVLFKIMRAGSAEARIFFATNLSLADWRVQLGNYSSAIFSVAVQKKNDKLVSLDDFRSNLALLVTERSPKHLILPELSQIMAWKLLRGKFRPLQKLVDSNSPHKVISATTEAFRLAEEPGKWKESINALTTLNGIGVATASAVLSAVYPAVFPFMADEVLEAVLSGGKREYTIKAYSEMRSLLESKRDLLMADTPESHSDFLTLEDIGKCIWVFAAKSALGPSGRSRGLSNSSNDQYSTLDMCDRDVFVAVDLRTKRKVADDDQQDGSGKRSRSNKR